MQVTLQYAAENLADLASAIDRGEEVEISRPEKPALKLIVSSPARLPRTAVLSADGKRILGAGVGEMRVPSWEEWQTMDRELALQINDSSLLPTDGE